MKEYPKTVYDSEYSQIIVHDKESEEFVNLMSKCHLERKVIRLEQRLVEARQSLPMYFLAGMVLGTMATIVVYALFASMK